VHSIDQPYNKTATLIGTRTLSTLALSLLYYVLQAGERCIGSRGHKGWLVHRCPCVQSLPKISYSRLVHVSTVRINLDVYQKSELAQLDNSNMARLEFCHVPILDLWIWRVVRP
jgi:hypothetical protein